MNDYISIYDGTTTKYLRVVAASYDVGIIAPEQVTRSLTSRAAKTYAPVYKYWQFVARVKGNESGSYAPWSTIIGWPSKASLTLTDFEGNATTVLMVTGGELKRQHAVPILDTSESFAYVPMRFEELL